MPRYEYECLDGHRDDVVRPVDERNDELECARIDLDGELCGRGMKRVFAKPAMSMDGRVFQDGRFDVNDWLANQ